MILLLFQSASLLFHTYSLLPLPLPVFPLIFRISQEKGQCLQDEGEGQIESIMAVVPFFLPLDPFFQSLVVCRAAGSLVYVHEAFESAFQICLVLKKCYSNLSSVSRNIVSHCLKLVQCALIEMLLDTLHLRGLCFTQSNSKIGKLCKRSYGAH